VSDPKEYEATLGLVAEKYGLSDEVGPDPEQVWVFRLDPRPA